MRVPVVWLSLHSAQGVIARGFWDEGTLEHLFAGRLGRLPSRLTFEHRADVPGSGGAVVVLPARHHVGDEAALTDALAPLDWALLILCGDEEGAFDWRAVRHPNLRVWIQTPYRGVHDGVDRRFGDGWPPRAPDVLRAVGAPGSRPTQWFFSGQVRDNRRRIEAARILRKTSHGRLLETDGFGEGLPYEDYLAEMARAKIVAAPAGFFTPDTFRLFEALEAGAVPVAETRTHFHTEDLGYWPFLCDGDPPFPVLDAWAEFPNVRRDVLADWPASANRCWAWWQGRKRAMTTWLREDVGALAGGPIEPDPDEPSDLVTVLIPTSPALVQPSTEALERVVASVREQPELAGAEIVLMFDGVRSEQEKLRAAYEEYQHRALWLANHEWGHVLPLRFEEHLHQAAMTRAALDRVRTPLVLFVEHDTPLVGEIDWAALCRAVRSDAANLVRLHHEARIHDEHLHLYPDGDEAQEVSGAPMVRTAQWSQRPHLATTDFYRWVLREHFGSEARTMIEDVMHGVVDFHWREHRDWDRFRLWVYRPPGDIKRSGHLDTRGGEPKHPMVFAYDGEPPAGAPFPTRAREAERAKGGRG